MVNAFAKLDISLMGTLNSVLPHTPRQEQGVTWLKILSHLQPGVSKPA
jgi:hypothetical protein